MKALSIRQPWAWLIAHGYKDIENRDWYAAYRGALAIHAGKGMTRAEYEGALDTIDYVGRTDIILPPFEQLARGGVVGVATLTGCVSSSSSRWFFGRYGLVLADARPLPCVPFKGALGFFDVPDALLAGVQTSAHRG